MQKIRKILQNPKSILVYIGFITVGFAVSSFMDPFGQTPRIVYIDNAVLLGNFEGSKEAQKAFEQNTAVWDANVDTLLVEMQNAIKQYEKEQRSMTEKEKELSQKLLNSQRQELINYKNAIDQKKADEESKLSEEIVVHVNAFIKKYGESHNYDLILGATASGNLLYSKGGLEITEEVLKELNEDYQITKQDTESES